MHSEVLPPKHHWKYIQKAYWEMSDGVKVPLETHSKRIIGQMIDEVKVPLETHSNNLPGSE